MASPFSSNTPTSTPTRPLARAIKSTISTRSSSSIPPSSQAFAPLVRDELRHRLTRYILPYAAGIVWSVMILWGMWGLKHGLRGVLFVIFARWLLVVAAVGWVGGVVPVLVGRKVYLTANRTPAASPSASLREALARPSTRRLAGTYAASAVLFLALHVVMAYTYEIRYHGDPKLALFVKSKKHPYYFNPRLLFLLLTQLFTAGAFALRECMNDRLVFPWKLAVVSGAADAPPTRFPFTPPQLLKTFLLLPLLTPTLALPPAMGLTAVLRAVILPIVFRVPFVGAVGRAFAGGVVIGSYTILLPLTHIPLLTRAWFLSASTVLLWEGAEMLFEGYISQPINITHLTPTPTLTLISGITSSPSPAQDEAIFQYTAYHSLLALASSSDAGALAQRTALFSDQKYSPSFWSHLCRESLLLLGHDYQHLLRRGKPAPSAPVASTITPVKREESLPGTPVHLLRQRVFKGKERESPVQAVLDAVASDGPLARAVEAVEEKVEMPEVFRSVVPTPVRSLASSPAVMGTRVGEVPKTLVQKVKGGLWSWTPRQWKDRCADVQTWWVEERISRVAETMWLPRKELDVVVIDVLTHLTAASLTEDQYGIVQRDIPRIIEALLSFLVEVEERIHEVNAMYTPPTEEDTDPKELQKKEKLRLEVEGAGEVLASVGDALREGVARIVHTFGIKLLAFKFPPRTAQKLQVFMDYC